MIDIVHVIPRLYPGGAERLVLQYACGLDRKNYRVHIMSSVGDGALRPEFEKSGVELIIGSREKHGGRLGVWKFLKSHLQRINPSIIHTHLLGADMIGYFWKRIAPTTIWISTSHNVEFHTPWLKRMLWKHILKKVDIVVAVSDPVQAYMRDHFNVPENKIKVIYNGTDLGKWSGVQDKLFAKKNISCATIGRLEEQKGHIYALEAFAKLTEKKWEYHIYGEGSKGEELKHVARSLKIEDKVIWHGQTTDVASQLSHIDVVIQPSLWEGMSLVVLECMAAGRVVIASAAAGEGLIESRVNGYIFHTGDATHLSEVMGEIFTHKSEAHRVARAARTYAKKNFDMNKHYQAIEALYDSVVPLL